MTPVPSLAKWGVSPPAELVYRTLTAFGPHRIGEINRTLDLPAQIVRSALDELYAVGGATPASAPRRSDDRVWMASAPKDFVATLRERRTRAALAAHAVKDLLDGTGVPASDAQLQELSQTGSVRPLHGFTSTRGRIAEVSAASQVEEIGMSPQIGYTPESLRAGAPMQRAARIRGVASLGLFVPSPANSEPGELETEMQSYGAEYRLLPRLPAKIIIYDRRTAFFPIDPSDLSRGAWEISAPSIVDSLVSLFLQRWELAKPIVYERKQEIGLTPRELGIVSLLAEGHTDDVVASKLNISRRSISYAIAGLMERYHTKNRFQLGLLLGARTVRQSKIHGGDEKDDPEVT